MNNEHDALYDHEPQLGLAESEPSSAETPQVLTVGTLAKPSRVVKITPEIATQMLWRLRKWVDAGLKLAELAKVDTIYGLAHPEADMQVEDTDLLLEWHLRDLAKTPAPKAKKPPTKRTKKGTPAPTPTPTVDLPTLAPATTVQLPLLPEPLEPAPPPPPTKRHEAPPAPAADGPILAENGSMVLL